MNIDTKKPTINSYPNHQGGAVLMVSLILLIALTMLGISALQATKFETRMAASTRAYNYAFENAERAIAEAVHYYKGQNMAQLPTKSSFETTQVVKVAEGKSQFRIMVGATKSSSGNLDGGSTGARYYLLEGRGESKDGIPVTLYAGIVTDTASDSGKNLTDNVNPNPQPNNDTNPTP